MHRRTLLKLLGALALSGCSLQGNSAKGLRVVVAGAGIIGASIAWHLAKLGATVTVIDRQGPATHASRGTFAWINATWAKQPQHYHTLSSDSLATWKVLQRELNLPIRWNGSLEWFDNPERQAKLAEQIAEQAQWGQPARMVNVADLATVEPHVDFGDAQQAAYSEADGAIDPVLATNALLGAAVKLGASVQYPCELTGVVLEQGKLVEVATTVGTIKADRLVLATGADPHATEQFADLAIPQRSTPGVIVITTPAPQLLSSIIVAPGIHMHQRTDGRIVLGEQGGPPKNPAHAARLEGRPNEFPTLQLGEEHAARMLEVARRFAPGIGNPEIEHVHIGWRPLPLDGHPVLGASPDRPDVYLAIMHSGVTLAPIVGQLAAHELTQDAPVARLDAYRPDRAFAYTKRY